MMKYFWDGFEKRSYDYAQEVRDLGEHYKQRSKEPPYSKTKGGLVGAGIGGLGGAALGALTAVPKGMRGKVNRGKGAIIGGLLGLGIGGLGGIFSAIENKLGIEEAISIAKMPPARKKDYLASLARRGEISE